MKTYRCYFLDQDSRVRASRQIACADDDAAVKVAANLLKQYAFWAAELWYRERRVGQWQRGLHPGQPPYPWTDKTTQNSSEAEPEASDDSWPHLWSTSRSRQ